ncbi:SGNH/GDSL hydrolase family protein [Dermacoccaceae bacterium W4C1]
MPPAPSARRRWWALWLSLAFLVAGLAPVAAADEPVRIMVVGDSISQGSSGDYTWRYRLWQGIAASGASGVSLVGTRDDLHDNVNSLPGSQYYAIDFPQKRHAALWGSTFQAENPTIAARVRSTGATVLAVQLGHNDLRYTLTPEQTIEQARATIAAAREANPSITIILGEVTPGWDPFAGQPVIAQQAAAYAAALPALVAQTSTEQSPVLIAHTAAEWIPSRHTYDGSHPSPEGEAVIARAYLRVLVDLGVIPQSEQGPLPAYTWQVAAPAPQLSAGPDSVRVAFSRESTGASAMAIRYRRAGGDWTELPYPVGRADGDTWLLSDLVDEGVYEVQLKPIKYLMSGLWGDSAWATVHDPKPGPATSTSATRSGSALRLTWTPGRNAEVSRIGVGQGYRPGQGFLLHQQLPYPTVETQWSLQNVRFGPRTVATVQAWRGPVAGDVVPVAVSGR